MSRNLLLSFACAAGTLVACAGEALSFTHRPQLAGKASLTSPGFEVTRIAREVADRRSAGVSGWVEPDGVWC